MRKTDVQPKCCDDRGLFYGPNRDDRRCWRHATPEDRARVQEYDRRGKAIGLEAAGWQSAEKLTWPYGPNISVESRGRMLDWAEAYGLRLAHPSHTCLRWLRKGRCMVAVCDSYRSHPSWWDHLTTWNRDGKSAVLVSQPYGLTDDDRADLARLDAEPGIHVEIRPDSWYGLGTTFVGVWHAGVHAAAWPERTRRDRVHRP